jgi:hypothetical protein
MAYKVHFVVSSGRLFCYSGDGLDVVIGEIWIFRPQGFGGLPRRGLRGTWKFYVLCIIVCISTTRYWYTYILRQRVCRLSYVAMKTAAQGWLVLVPGTVERGGSESRLDYCCERDQ